MKIFYTKIYHTKISLHENFQIYGSTILVLWLWGEYKFSAYDAVL